MKSVYAENVSLDLGGRRILDDVSVDFSPGSVHALIGPNGAGKSTLLGVLAGDRVPTAGSVRLGDRRIGEWSVSELARVRSVLTQEQTVSFPFTAHEVVMLGRSPWQSRRSLHDDDAIVFAALDAVELGDRAEQPVTTMSGGERARVAGVHRPRHGAAGPPAREP